MSKRNIAYIKPEEPSFLRRLKEQVGYKEGPTVDTKREHLGPVNEEDLLDTEEEQPTIVVLNPGDLTAEEAAKAQNDKEKEINETPADLSKPVVFKPPTKSKKSDQSEPKKSKRASTATCETKSKKSKSKSLLSFEDDEEDE